MNRGDIRPRITANNVRNQILYEIDQYRGRSWVDQIALRVPSDQQIEDYAWLGATPGWREKVGPYVAKRLREYAMSIRNHPYESTLALAKKWIKDDKTGEVGRKISQHVEGLMGHDATQLSTWISNGTGSTSGTCFDGEYLFDTDHSWGDSGSIRNLLTASQCTYLDVSTATKPTAEEVGRAVRNVIQYMIQNFKDDQGNLIHANAKSFLIMTGMDLMVPFTEAFTNDRVSTGTGTIENPLKAMVALDQNMKFNLSINPLLSGWTTQFAVFRTDSLFPAFIIQEKGDIVRDILDESSDHWKKEDEMLVMFKKECYWAYGNPFAAAHATFS